MAIDSIWCDSIPFRTTWLIVQNWTSVASCRTQENIVLEFKLRRSHNDIRATSQSVKQYFISLKSFTQSDYYHRSYEPEKKYSTRKIILLLGICTGNSFKLFKIYTP